MFGDKEVLVPARKLLGLPGGTQETASSIEYFHILLDRHEVVCANGAWSETLLTGPDTCRQIALLFPELASPSHVVPPARRIVEPRWTGQMIQRHLANGRDLHEPGGAIWPETQSVSSRPLRPASGAAPAILAMNLPGQP